MQTPFHHQSKRNFPIFCRETQSINRLIKTPYIFIYKLFIGYCYRKLVMYNIFSTYYFPETIQYNPRIIFENSIIVCKAKL